MTSPETTLDVSTTVNASITTVWEKWTNPADILLWNNMSPDWCTTKAINDPRPGGKFLFVMALKDGSFSFDYEGTYDKIEPNKLIQLTLTDGRTSTIRFTNSDPVVITESFEPSPNEPAEVQRAFCQYVLNAFKNYVEG